MVYQIFEISRNFLFLIPHLTYLKKFHLSEGPFFNFYIYKYTHELLKKLLKR